MILYETREHVATITLNRPEKLNALNAELVGQLVQAFERARADDDVRAVVLTGAGRAFCAGADLGGGDGAARTADDWWERLQGNIVRQMAMRDFLKPIVAAVRGYCLGRGCELALWCDIVIAAEDAKFGEPEIRQGSVVASIIPWLANIQQAKLLLLTGDTISAADAHAIGLVVKVVPPDALLPEAERIARRIAKVPPFAVRYNKQAINAMYDAMGFRMAIDQGHKLEVLSNLRLSEVETIDGVRLEERRREAGIKGMLAARDAPFAED